MDNLGLNFREARLCVKQAIDSALKEYELTDEATNSTYYSKKQYEIFAFISFPIILCIVIFAISLGVGISRTMSAGLILSIIILAFIAIFNVTLIRRILHTKRNEVATEIKQILKDYDDWLESYQPSNTAQSTSSARILPCNHAMVLGHPHVSLVSCWRNGLWQRVPVLLLAEGDVIALMGGDLTPGKVIELHFTSKETNAPTSISGGEGQTSWKLGAKLKAGHKIRLRRSNDGKPIGKTVPGYAQHSFVKHRSLPPDSVELLILSGDIRCFQMTETPIFEFIKTLVSSRQKASSSTTMDTPFFQNTEKEVKGSCVGQSYVRKLFALILKRAYGLFLPALLLLFIIAIIIRLSLFGAARIDWATTVTVPIGVILMCFIPMSFPLGYLLSESLTLADILATIEASLEEPLKGQDVAGLTSNSPSPYQRGVNPNMNDMRTSSARASAGDRRSSFGMRMSAESSSDESSEEDEFLDEDIDEREEEIAEEASKLVSWKRFSQYLLHVIFSRLGMSAHVTWLRLFGPKTTFLPLPLIQSKLLETLGAVTMVCFVDDDIICEGYSVTEEIFLLVTGEKDVTAGRKGTILDLHANPQAEGSRFENPLWWKFLPNLKPIALNSMLTYTSTMSTDILLREIPKHMKRKSTRSRTNTYTDPMPIFDIRTNQMVPLVSTRNKVKADGSTQHRREPTEMERELVGHVRKTIPLESLKELAEEIGFVSEDVSMFTKLFELNVLAPRLGDAQLLEDYHAWGQEETRRRGTLLAQVRSVIVKDSRGGLQMMSQGDPSLIVKYCREFWDGASIAPLNTDDRVDILNLYDRYRKEDFDVVCFAYSPIPVALQPLILAAVASNSDFLAKSTAEHDMKLPLSMGTYNDGNVQCLLFVDPSTASDLMEANTNRNPRRTSTQPTSNTQAKRVDPTSIAPVNSVLSSLETFQPIDPKSSLDTRSRDLSNPPIEFEKIYEPTIAEESVDIEHPVKSTEPHTRAASHTVSSSPPSLQDISALLSAVTILESPGASDTAFNIVITPPVSTMASTKLNRGISLEMRSRSESNLTKNLQGYSDSVMYTNSESLNCETLIHEMEQLDSHEDLSVLQEDGMTTLIESTSIPTSARYGIPASLSPQPQDIFSSANLPSIIELKPEYMDESFHDAEILDESLMDNEEPEERPRRHSFDDETVTELMNTHRSKSMSLDADDLSPTHHIKSTSFNDVRLSGCSQPGSPREGDARRLSTDHAPKSILTTSDSYSRVGSNSKLNVSPASLSRQRTKSLDSFPKEDIFADDMYALNHVTDDNQLNVDMQPDITSPPTTSPTAMKSISETKAMDMKKLNQAFNRNLSHLSTHHQYPQKYRNSNTSNAIHQSIRRASKRNAALDSLPPSGANTSNQRTSSENNTGQHPSGQTLNETKKRSLGAQLWPLMRQQVFLGLAASSVPVKPEVPNLLENLNSAGVRFIYFSPRNMRRSKPVAEKIGIQFDWNCAISLRSLGEHDEHDPHRYISSYADWDVQAKMPHGVEAIKKHLQVVDNVPLLVNLYTDATPSTTCEMIEVFKSYGEVVLTIGSSYRASNQPIFRKSDVGVAVAMLPGSSSHIPSAVDAVLAKIPLYSEMSLSQSDMILTFRLVGLGSIPLLQLPSTLTKDVYKKPVRHHRSSLPSSSNIAIEPEQLRLAAITETIRKGRLFLLNIIQSLAFLCTCTLSLALWPIIVQVTPITIPPSLSPSIALLFLLWYYPVMVISIMLSDTSEKVMKSTPRKSILQQKAGDETRFLSYLFIRTFFVIISLFLQGWITAASIFKVSGSSWNETMRHTIHIHLHVHDVYPADPQRDFRQDMYGYWLVQDVIATQLILQIIAQAATLMERGQKRLPELVEHSQFYIASAVILLTHLWIMATRMIMRSSTSTSNISHDYQSLDWIVWFILFLLPLISVGLGLLVNRLDDKWHRRYLQFLRLEFDTKLGMHSPR